MSKKLMIPFIVVAVIFSGALGVAAISNSSTSEAEVTNSGNGSVDEKITETGLISLEEARDITLQEFDGTIQSIELDKDDGQFVYEIEARGDSHTRVELEIDAKTGEIVEFDYDAKDVESISYEDITLNGSNTEGTISLNEAVFIAIKDTPGDITEISFDSDDKEYEIELYSNEDQVEIKIDSRTGKIKSKEVND
ncbi:hypothetical protein ACA29_20615 [Lederbergia galactosidilytica]|uniref:PepSY domain-containing protein n=1 Tax=Lederbergia galactosidilytica TaxID=217031 RepID=A0A0Q9XQM7_9BACI|nr:hypothetical protein ACA29_20615 [Lederbergia galactosidilytica]